VCCSFDSSWDVVEVADLGRIPDQVDRGDTSVYDGESDDISRSTRGSDEGAGGTVDDRGLGKGRERRARRQDLSGDVARPCDRRTGEEARSAPVHPEDHVRVEHAQQGLEIPGSRRGKERVDDATLDRQIGIRARRASWRAAAGVFPTTSAISSNGTAKTSWSTNASRSAGVNVSSTTSSASPTESAMTASRSGLSSMAPVTIGSGSQLPA
jgi:hypothetical protein